MENCYTLYKDNADVMDLLGYDINDYTCIDSSIVESFKMKEQGF